MPAERQRAMGGGCIGGIVGAVLGIVIGSTVGQLGFAPKREEVKNNPDPLGREITKFFGLVDGCLGFLGMLVGAGVGGTIGGIAGSVVGAGVATKTEQPRWMRPPFNQESAPSSDESIDSEVSRLQERIADLARKKRNEHGPPEP